MALTIGFLQKSTRYFAKREESTGQWFIDSPEFTDWLPGTSRTLCCPGIRTLFPSIRAITNLNGLTRGSWCR